MILVKGKTMVPLKSFNEPNLFTCFGIVKSLDMFKLTLFAFDSIILIFMPRYSESHSRNLIFLNSKPHEVYSRIYVRYNLSHFSF